MTPVVDTVPTDPGAAREGRPALTVAIPLYNSEETVGRLVDTLVEVLAPRYGRLEIVLVNDGSRDRTHEEALAAVGRHERVVTYVRLARNFGEHNAVMCALAHATGDAIAVIDDDFQNPPSEIVHLVDKLHEGYDVVYSAYAVKHHSRFRNLGSRFANLLAARLLPMSERFYLSSFKVLNAFAARKVVEYEGPYPYVDGLILRSTDSICSVLVRHAPRAAGRSNYTLRRLVRLWLNMFTGFSILPLRVASLLGIVMSLVGLLLALFSIVSWSLGGIFRTEPIPPGWASLMVTVITFAGIQLLVLGVIGEYLGRLFLTQNRSPQYVVRDVVESRPTRSEAEADGRLREAIRR